MGKLNTDILPRAISRAEIGAPHLTEKQIYYLNSRISGEMLDDISLPVGIDRSNGDNGPWYVPASGYVPRIFMVTRDKEGRDKVMSLSASGYVPGSPEFWRQVQLGNVFAYPAGKADPVQIQVSVNNGRSELNYSRPVTADNLPVTPAKPAGFWKRLAYYATFGRAYRNDIKAYANRQADQDDIKKKFADNREHRSGLDLNRETQQAEEEKMRRKVRKLEEARDAWKQGEKQMVSVFRPDPEFIPDPDAGMLRNECHLGLYTREHFNDLEKYGKDRIDLDSIKIGDSGESVTPETFSAVTMYALWDPDIALTSPDADIYAVSSLKKHGFSENDAKEIMSYGYSSMYTSDLFIVPPRDNEGTYFKTMTNKGRRAAVDAFNAYRDGDTSKLGKLIAGGINRSAMAAAHMKSFSLPAQTRAPFAMSEKLLDLIDKDPALMDAAVKNGMDPEKLRTVRGIRALNRINQDMLDAKFKLQEAQLKGKELSQEEMRDCTFRIMKHHVAMSRLAAENSTHSPEIQQKQAEVMELLVGGSNALSNEAEKELKKNNNGHLPDPATVGNKKDIYFQTATYAHEYMTFPLQKQPRSLQNLTAEEGMKDLDRFTEALVEENFKGRSQQEIHDTLMKTADYDMSKNMAEYIRKTEEAMRGPKEAPGPAAAAPDNTANKARAVPENGPVIDSAGPVKV